MTGETQQGQTNGNAVATKGISFGCDPIGDITSIERYTNITQAPSPATDAADTTLTYNNLGQLTSEDHSHNGTAIDNLSWTFDTLDRVSTFSSNDGLATYGYDKASQIVSATYSGANPPPNFSTTYDPNGVRNAGGDTVGPNNHLTSDGTFNFTYDPEGNVINRVRISTAQANDHEVDYSWDYRNCLTDAYFYNNSKVLTQHIHYVYDVFDHLIERDVDPTGGGTYTQIAHYVWDISSSAPGGDGADGSALGAREGGVVLEFNGQQQLTNRYLNGPNTNAADQYFSTLAEEAVSSLTTPGTVTFDLLDDQGSVRNVVDADGTLEDHINYTLTGQVASESNPSVPHLTSFAGGFLDPATQLLNEYHRWLVLTDGFWASPDPVGLLAGDTNVTRYVGNSPSNYVDSSGLAYNPFKLNWHHLLDQAIFNDAFMARHGITDLNINDKEYGWMLKAGKHTGEGGLHPKGWSKDWQEWVDRKEAAHVTITKPMILRRLERMKHDYRKILETGKPATMCYTAWGEKLRSAAQRRASRLNTRNGFVVLPRRPGPASGAGGSRMGRIGANVRGAGAAAAPLLIDLGVGIVDDVSGGRLSNALDNITGATPTDALNNMINLATSGRHLSHLFSPKIHYSPDRDELYMDEYMAVQSKLDDAKDAYFEFHGAEMDRATESRIRERLNNSYRNR